MDLDERKREIVERHGPWTSHDIHLGDGVWTRGRVGRASAGMRRVAQLVEDLAPRPLGELRVLDLGCLEGGYAIELALRGATVVGLDAREAHLAKARFAAEAVGVAGRAEFRQEDVRALDPAVHGTFDVVLCLGLLYHLDGADVVDLLRRIAAVCTGLAIVDTHVALRGRRTIEAGGHAYRGRTFVEHSRRAGRAEQEASGWASVGNPDSFWPTRSSLLSAMAHAGFSTVLEAGIPADPPKPPDRLTLVGIPGERVALRTAPGAADPPHEVPERRLAPPPRNQLWAFNAAKRLVLDLRARRRR